MIITTSPNRVKEAGYWCFDGDAESSRLLRELNRNRPTGVAEYTLDSEIDARDILDNIGISSTLLALGVPRARYKEQADEVLHAYIVELFDYLERSLTLRLKTDVKLTQEKLRYSGAANQARRTQLLNTYLKLKYGTEDPGLVAVCSALIILLSEYPDNIKAVHATKAVLSIPEYDEPLTNAPQTKTYVALQDKLWKLLDG